MRKTNSHRPDDSGADTQHWLGVLQHNLGFDEPQKWVATARRWQFQSVAATKLQSCPDCGGDAWSRMGQFIHYSTLLTLRRCPCGLIYADTRIDPAVIQSHFEAAYKNEEYFAVGRREVFDQVVRLADELAPAGASIIDIGGAGGQLLGAIQSRRPDLRCLLVDPSSVACERAAKILGDRTLCRSIAQLKDHGVRYDIALLIDVAYYETDVRGLWETIDRILTDRGVLIMRVPNKLLLMRLGQSLLFGEHKHRARRIEFFNPEHVSVFSRPYLAERLRSLRFAELQFLPSALLASDGLVGQLSYLYYRLSKMLHAFSLGALSITPSQLVIARRSPAASAMRAESR